MRSLKSPSDEIPSGLLAFQKPETGKPQRLRGLCCAACEALIACSWHHSGPLGRWTDTSVNLNISNSYENGSHVSCVCKCTAEGSWPVEVVFRARKTGLSRGPTSHGLSRFQGKIKIKHSMDIQGVFAYTVQEIVSDKTTLSPCDAR